MQSSKDSLYKETAPKVEIVVDDTHVLGLSL